MKKTMKLLTTFLIVAMNLASPQAIRGGEEAGVTNVSECIHEGKTCRLVTNIKNSFIESHAHNLHLGPASYLRLNDRAKAPLGVYGLEVDGAIVGLHSITPIYHGGYLVASVITDIFIKYRSSGYGTLLRNLAGKELEKIIGKFVNIKSQSGGEELTKFPLSCLFSNNEWNYGVNGASTRSALKAGYGIACISNRNGLVKMLYPKNESLWEEGRINNLISASRILGTRCNHKDAIPFLVKIINDLDLTQLADVETLNSLISFMDYRFGSDTDYERTLDECINGLSRNNLDLLSKITKGIESAGVVQKIPLELLNVGGTLSAQVKDSLSQRLTRLNVDVKIN